MNSQPIFTRDFCLRLFGVAAIVATAAAVLPAPPVDSSAQPIGVLTPLYRELGVD